MDAEADRQNDKDLADLMANRMSFHHRPRLWEPSAVHGNESVADQTSHYAAVDETPRSPNGNALDEAESKDSYRTTNSGSAPPTLAFASTHYLQPYGRAADHVNTSNLVSQDHPAQTPIQSVPASDPDGGSGREPADRELDRPYQYAHGHLGWVGNCWTRSDSMCDTGTGADTTVDVEMGG